MHHRSAFTMVEMIVVISIILALAGLLTPVVQIASKAASRTNTQALLGKVDAALHRFKTDVGVFPYQTHDTSGAQFTAIDNRLAYHLAHTLTSTERDSLRADEANAASAYDAGVHRFTPVNVPINDNKSAASQVLNRMGRERARLMIDAGHGAVTGVGAQDGIPLLSSGATSKGWGSDYLGSDIAKRNIKGDAIVDYYGNPLLYVCPVVCGAQGGWVAPSILPNEYPRQKRIDADAVGFATRGRTETVSLSSDIRTTAARPFTHAYELWSIGADRRANPQRDDVSNSDNLAADAYTKGLLP
jgi:prepilin-type N-terminal cleavage/methylation domain-containing protein